MKIQLIGDLHPELTAIGLAVGDIIEAIPDPVSQVGGMHFSRYYNGRTVNCSIWPENYQIDKNTTIKSSNQ